MPPPGSTERAPDHCRTGQPARSLRASLPTDNQANTGSWVRHGGVTGCSKTRAKAARAPTCTEAPPAAKLGPSWTPRGRAAGSGASNPAQRSEEGPEGDCASLRPPRLGARLAWGAPVGRLTLETIRGSPCSRPPLSVKPHGAPPASCTCAYWKESSSLPPSRSGSGSSAGRSMAPSRSPEEEPGAAGRAGRSARAARHQWDSVRLSV